MNVDLTADQQALIQHAINSGRLKRPEDAVQDALALWEEREHRRSEIVAALESAQASLAKGEGRVFTSREDVTAFANEIKQRGLARLTAQQKSL